jgi:hypothetical protein
MDRNNIMTNKILYKGTFNWHGETFVFFRYAHSEAQAYKLFLIELSNKLRRTYSSIDRHFYGTDHYKIVEEKQS